MYFSSEGYDLLAHRGFAGHPQRVTENSLGAFQLAVEFGATAVESDVHATSDGVAVLLHDAELPLADGSVGPAVATLTAAQLREYPLPDGSVAPLLLDTLLAMPHTKFNLDIKAAAAALPAAQAIAEAGALDRVLLTSFSRGRREAAAQALPKITATSAASSEAVVLVLSARLGLTPLVRRCAQRLSAVQLPGTGIMGSLLTRSTIARLRTAGLRVHIWTVNDPGEMRRWLSRGVDGLVTDRTDLAAEVLAQFPPRTPPLPSGNSGA